MKVNAVGILAFLIVLYLLTAIHAVESVSIASALMRLFRLANIPLFLLFIVVLLPRQAMTKMKAFAPLILPVVLILAVNVLQLAALPAHLAATHLTISVRFSALFLLYICILLAINRTSVDRLMRVLTVSLSAVFVVGVIQYVFLIFQSGSSFVSVFANYGQPGARYQLEGILGSANENANGFMTILPLVLLQVERKEFQTRLLLRGAVFFLLVLALLFNGTRTALLISLPLITFLFYSDLSVKKAAFLALPASVFGAYLLLFSQNIVGRAFGQESSQDGTLGWRVEHVWRPAIDYTAANSPLFGFGSRGWEFIGAQIGFTDHTGIDVAPAHSGYIWTFVSWGLFGLLAYVVLLVVLLVESFRLSQSRKKTVADAGKALFCSMVGYCIWAFISNVMFTVGWVILMYLAAAIAAYKFLNVCVLARGSPA